jgi:7,8-dihydroneopterin aldolase/epimerase/oxygenase
MPQRDVVFLEGLEARAVVGVYPHERKRPRRLLLDVEVACDASQAAKGDDLRRAIDYDALARDVIAHVAAQAPRLLETLAVSVAERVKRRFAASWVRVRVVKPGVVPAARAVGVVVARGRRPLGAR